MEPNIQEVCDLYHASACTPSDIWEHVPTLMRLARMCDHVTELGTRKGVSTAGLLRGLPKRLVTYDLQRHECIDRLASAAVKANVDFAFVQDNTLTCEIEETDFLFIDTLHTFMQLRRELNRHGHKVKKFIAMHDTISYGFRGEIPGDPGLCKAIAGYFRSPENLHKWRLIEEFTNNNGLTIYMRNGSFTPCQ